MDDKEKALRVLAELIRQAGDEWLEGRTRLFKAFYFAHLFYAAKSPCGLTNWPIVNMPNGPGIHAAEELLAELERRQWITREPAMTGPYPSEKYHINQIPDDLGLSQEERESVRQAFATVQGRTAQELSAFVHEFSRSWQRTKSGEELDVYLDIIPEDEFERRQKELERIAKCFREVHDAS